MIRHFTAAAALALGCSLILPAHADGIKEGQWEYTTTMQMPGMPTQQPQLPPGMKLPPGVQMPKFDARGMTRTFLRCTTNDKPVPTKDDDGPQKCEMKKFDRNGGKVTWSMQCSGPKGDMSGEGSATYVGDSMTSEMKMKGEHEGHPIEMNQKTTGRYIGPCKS